MRIKVLAFAASLVLISNLSAGIPQSPTTTSSPQAATLLAQSAKALTGSTAVNDVTLTGTVEWIAGSDDDTGTAVYQAIFGASRLNMTFHSGARSEVINMTGDVAVGAWSGSDGVSHSLASHNLMVKEEYFPPFTLQSLINSPNTVLKYVGDETKNGSTVSHINSMQQYPGFTGEDAALIEHLTQIDFYLTKTTLLPAAIVFNIHPDDNAQLDIVVELRFADFRSVNGTQVPFHIQKYINNVLAADFQMNSASFNQGLSSADFSIQ